MAHLLSRSVAAYTFTAERLAAESEKLYFWTFTFKSVPITDEMAMQDWADLMKRLTYYYPMLKGIRVVELHQSHGIHFHCIVNYRIQIDRLRSIFRGNGCLVGGPRTRYLDFGRLSVTRCDPQTILYLSKYMTKQYRDENNFGRRRRWGTIGGLRATRCKDIEYDSPFHQSKQQMFPKVKINYVTMLLLSHYTTLWGHVDDWPREYVLRVCNYEKAALSSMCDKEVGLPQREERHDLPYVFYNAHLQSCIECNGGASHCERGFKLWQDSVARWQQIKRDEITARCSDPF